MSATTKKWLKNILRWGIALFGIGYVLSNISLFNRVMIASPVSGWPISVRLAAPANEDDSIFVVQDPRDEHKTLTIPRSEVLAKADPVRVTVREANGELKKYDTLARKVLPNDPHFEHWPFLVVTRRNLWQRYWDIHRGELRYIDHSQIVEPHDVGRVPYPLIEHGLWPMVKNADIGLLLAAIFVFPVVFVITSYRWHELLKALDIRMTMARAFVINMVGAFWNTAMPGSTGGDVFKMYYAAKQTEHRTRAVMSVIVDRVLGLLALIILGGTMAAYQYFKLDPADPAKRKCGQVALGSALLILATIVGLVVFYTPILRRLSGLDFIMKRLPMQKQLAKAIDTMEIYRRRPLLILWAIIITLPVHATVVISATFAGMAFSPPLPLRPLYYWAVVPVVVLAGSIPISPQGAGVMEFFAIILTRRQGCTVSQAFALTMSIRLVQMLWNLTGGVFVFRGGYHAPTEREQKELENDGRGDTGVQRVQTVELSP